MNIVPEPWHSQILKAIKDHKAAGEEEHIMIKKMKKLRFISLNQRPEGKLEQAESPGRPTIWGCAEHYSWRFFRSGKNLYGRVENILKPDEKPKGFNKRSIHAEDHANKLLPGEMAWYMIVKE